MASATPVPPRDWGQPGYGVPDAAAQYFLGPDRQFQMRDLANIAMKLIGFGMNPALAFAKAGTMIGKNYFQNRGDSPSGDPNFVGPPAPPGWQTWLNQYTPATNPYQTMQNMEWMNNDPSDPFGYLGVSGGPEGAIADSLSDRLMGRFEDRMEANPSLAAMSQASQFGGGMYGGYGGGGMNVSMLPVPGMPPIPMISGPRYEGAPYNPQAFGDYNETGDTSWWDQWQSHPWQWEHQNLGGPQAFPTGPGFQSPGTGFSRNPTGVPRIAAGPQGGLGAGGGRAGVGGFQFPGGGSTSEWAHFGDLQGYYY